MSLIQIVNFSFGYNELLFEDVNIHFDTSMKIGLIGDNGKGKTTFLNVLKESHEYRKSIIHKTHFSYFPYTVDNEYILTIDIINDLLNDCPIWKIEKEMNLLNVHLDCLYQLFSTLSEGEKTKILLIILFLKEEEFILIDEPTNHLDMDSRDILASYLNKKKGYILVSHDRSFMNKCIDYVLEIREKKMYLTHGNFETWYNEREKRWQYESVQNERLKKEIRDLDKAAKQMANWSDKVEKSKNGTRVAGLKVDKGHVGHMSAKMMKKSKNAQRRKEKAIEDKQELLKDIDEKEEIILTPLDTSIKLFASLKDVSIVYDRCIVENFSLDIYKGDKIALIGPNGCGKSSLLKAIIGENDYQGEIRINPQINIVYVNQQFDFLKGSLKDYIISQKGDIPLTLTILRKLGCPRLMFDKKLETLSYGQRRKVMIAVALSKKAHLYLFDEILNYIDLKARMMIEEMLKDSEATILFVEHDKHFVDAIATKTIEIKKL